MAESNAEFHTNEAFILREDGDPSDPHFRCTACGSRTMSDYRGHIKTPAHHRAVQRLVDQTHADEAMLQAVRENNQQMPDIPPPLGNDFDLHDAIFPLPDSPDRPFTPLSYLRDLQFSGASDVSSESNHSDHVLDLQSLRAALEAMANPAGHAHDDDDFSTDLDEELVIEDLGTPRENGWYPFKKKEHIAALLIIGSTRSLLSRLQYQRIRSILRICDVNLPEWGTLRALSNRLKRKIDLVVSARVSPTGKPLFGLKVQTIVQSELANPLVSPHMVFMPELPDQSPINRLSQSQKWREEFPPHLRVQMVVSKCIHYYIYEPVQVLSGQLVIPMFFYQQGDKLMAKCIPALVEPGSQNLSTYNIFFAEEPPFDSPALISINVQSFWRLLESVKIGNEDCLSNHCGDHMFQHTSRGVKAVPLINPWRIKADGKIIRHIPLTIY